jgi:hypothetical protein
MFLLQLIRFFYRVLSIICPVCAGKLAFWQFQRTSFKKTRPRELAIYHKFAERRIPFEEEDLFVYESGPATGYPIIMFHGWESNPGSMYGIADFLANTGYRVIVMGFPAHGRSTLKKTNMVHSSGAVLALFNHYRLKHEFSIVTHSFGSGASAIALSGKKIKADKLIFITSSEVIKDIFDDYARMIGLGKKAYAYLLHITEAITPVPIKDFVISRFLQTVSYDQLTIIHDIDDKVIPFANAIKIADAVPRAKVISVKGKGHYRILWDEEIYQMILEALPTK